MVEIGKDRKMKGNGTGKNWKVWKRHEKNLRQMENKVLIEIERD